MPPAPPLNDAVLANCESQLNQSMALSRHLSHESESPLAIRANDRECCDSVPYCICLKCLICGFLRHMKCIDVEVCSGLSGKDDELCELGARNAVVLVCH